MVSVQTQIDRARYWAVTNQPFYGSLSASLKDVITSDVKTSATDGVFIYWNPDFVQQQDDEQMRYTLLHETLHPGLGHLWRLPMDADGNIAGDHVINLILKNIPGVRAPDGVLCDEKYRGLAEEEVLADIRKNKPKPQDPQDPSGGQQGQGQPQSGQGGQGGQGGGQPQQSQGQPQSGQGQPSGHSSHGGHGCPCGGIQAPAVDPASSETTQAQSEKLREAWEGRVIQAAQAQQAAGVGETPGEMQRILDRIRHQTIDWRLVFEEFVKSAVGERNNWSRAARRHAWQKVFIPSKRADRVGYVIFARDTSGSVDDGTCAQYSALITDCVSETGCKGLVIDADSKIQAEYEIDPFDQCPLTAKGGGGTDFRPVFARANELVEDGEHVAGIVYLTDLYGPAPESSEIPTLWLCTTDKEGPFGRTVKIEV